MFKLPFKIIFQGKTGFFSHINKAHEVIFLNLIKFYEDLKWEV